jgi:hypothetical protein
MASAAGLSSVAKDQLVPGSLTIPLIEVVITLWAQESLVGETLMEWSHPQGERSERPPRMWVRTSLYPI